VIPEYHEILNADDIRLPVVVPFLDVGKDLDLNKGLLRKLRIAFNHFQCHLLFAFMVERLQHLPIGSLSYLRQDLISVGNMIILYYFVLLPKSMSAYSWESKPVWLGSMASLLWAL